MNVIRELHGMVRRFASRRDGLPDRIFREDAKYTRLLNIILANEDLNETELHESMNRAIGRNWRVVKHRLMYKLVDLTHLVHLNPGMHTKQVVGEFRCEKLLFPMLLCRRFGSFKAANHMAKQVLKTAGNHGYTFAAFQAACVLRDTSLILGNLPQHQHYFQLQRKLFAVLQVEQELESAWSMLQAACLHHLMPDPQTCSQIKQRCVSAVEDFELGQSPRAMQHYHNCLDLCRRANGDYLTAIEHYETLYEYSSDKFHIIAWTACYSLIRCAVLSGSYSSGLRHIEAGAPLVKTGSFNWFQFNAAAFLFYLRFDRARARELFERTVDHPDWRKRAERVEVWRVFEAYLLILAPQAPPAVSAFAGGFSFSELNKEFEFCRRDKNGLNIALPLVRICWARRPGFYSVAENHWNNLTNYLRTNGRERDGRFARLRVLLAHLGRLLRSEQSPRGADGMIDGGPHEELAEIGRIDGPMYEEIAPFEQLWTALAEEPRPSASARHNRKGRS